MTELVSDITELLILWPHLAPALERDAGTSAEQAVSGRADPAFRLPVNADVLNAVTYLTGEVPTIAQWAAEVCGERPRVRSIESHLWHMTRWHERMLVTAAVDQAAQLAAAVRSMVRTVKMALGLRTADVGLGQYCPLHDDDLSELVRPGNDATLRYARLDAAGQPIEVRVEWSQHTGAACRKCRATWVTGPDLLTLRRQLRAADQRRTEAARKGAA